MRVFSESSFGRWYPYASKHLYGKLACLALRPLFMLKYRLGYLVAYGQNRIERGHRLLKDHRDHVASHAAHAFFIQSEQVLSAKAYLSTPILGRRHWHELKYRKRRDRFAAA